MKDLTDRLTMMELYDALPFGLDRQSAIEDLMGRLEHVVDITTSEVGSALLLAGARVVSHLKGDGAKKGDATQRLVALAEDIYPDEGIERGFYLSALFETLGEKKKAIDPLVNETIPILLRSDAFDKEHLLANAHLRLARLLGVEVGDTWFDELQAARRYLAHVPKGKERAILEVAIKKVEVDIGTQARLKRMEEGGYSQEDYHGFRKLSLWELSKVCEGAISGFSRGDTDRPFVEGVLLEAKHGLLALRLDELRDVLNNDARERETEIAIKTFRQETEALVSKETRHEEEARLLYLLAYHRFRRGEFEERPDRPYHGAFHLVQDILEHYDETPAAKMLRDAGLWGRQSGIVGSDGSISFDATRANRWGASPLKELVHSLATNEAALEAGALVGMGAFVISAVAGRNPRSLSQAGKMTIGALRSKGIGLGLLGGMAATGITRVYPRVSEVWRVGVSSVSGKEAGIALGHLFLNGIMMYTASRLGGINHAIARHKGSQIAGRYTGGLWQKVGVGALEGFGLEKKLVREVAYSFENLVFLGALSHAERGLKILMGQHEAPVETGDIGRGWLMVRLFGWIAERRLKLKMQQMRLPRSQTRIAILQPDPLGVQKMRLPRGQTGIAILQPDPRALRLGEWGTGTAFVTSALRVYDTIKTGDVSKMMPDGEFIYLGIYHLGNRGFGRIPGLGLGKTFAEGLRLRIEWNHFLTRVYLERRFPPLEPPSPPLSPPPFAPAFAGDPRARRVEKPVLDLEPLRMSALGESGKPNGATTPDNDQGNGPRRGGQTGDESGLTAMSEFDWNRLRHVWGGRQSGPVELNAKKFRDHLKRMGLTQSEVAAALGMSSAAITHYVKGRYMLPNGLLDALAELRDGDRDGAKLALAEFRRRTIEAYKATYPYWSHALYMGRRLKQLGIGRHDVKGLLPTSWSNANVDLADYIAAIAQVRNAEEAITALRRVREQRPDAPVALLPDHRADNLNRRFRAACDKLRIEVGHRFIKRLSDLTGIPINSIRNWYAGTNPVSRRVLPILEAMERAKSLSELHIEPTDRYVSPRSHRRNRQLNRVDSEVLKGVMAQYDRLINTIGREHLRYYGLTSDADLEDLRALVMTSISHLIAEGRKVEKPLVVTIIKRRAVDMYRDIANLSSYEVRMAIKVKALAKELGRTPNLEDLRKRYPEVPDHSLEVHLDAYRRYRIGPRNNVPIDGTNNRGSDYIVPPDVD